MQDHSVWKAFDQMQVCYTMGPQLKHYYQNGTWKNCSALVEEFKFSSSLLSLTAQDAQKLIQERYGVKEEKKKLRSSNSVWELRSEPPTSFLSLSH